MQDSSAFQLIAIDTIHESTTNPRRTFDETKLYELAESIKHNGFRWYGFPCSGSLPDRRIYDATLFD